MTAEQRKRREEMRMHIVDRIEESAEVPCVVRVLRVSEKSVYLWRCAWESAGQ